MENEGGVVVRGRVEIDTRQPFRSVKEAVSLFGEKILVGEIYTKKLKETQTKRGGREEVGFAVPTAKAELEETKQNLEKSKEEGNLMAYYLHSLQKELEQTKKELQQLKISREFVLSSDRYHHHHYHKPPPAGDSNDDEIGELKFIENSDNASALTQFNHHQRECELEKKRSVKFASPPMLTRVIISNDDRDHLKVEGSNSSPSIDHKPKRKPLFSGLGLLFTRKKGNRKSGVGTPRA